MRKRNELGLDSRQIEFLECRLWNCLSCQTRQKVLPATLIPNFFVLQKQGQHVINWNLLSIPWIKDVFSMLSHECGLKSRQRKKKVLQFPISLFLTPGIEMEIVRLVRLFFLQRLRELPNPNFFFQNCVTHTHFTLQTFGSNWERAAATSFHATEWQAKARRGAQAGKHSLDLHQLL